MRHPASTPFHDLMLSAISPGNGLSAFVSHIQKLGRALDIPISEGRRGDFVQDAYDSLHDDIIYELFVSTNLQDILADSRIQGIQHSTVFGDLQITIYKSKLFYIELLYWLDGATTIHDHAFEGAFAILDGCAVQSIFDFKRTDHVSDGFWLGEAVLLETRLIKTRTVNRIEAGSSFIHSTFHLAQPSVSIVIRTDTDEQSTTQLDYDPPYVAINADAISPYVVKRVKALAVLSRIENDVFSRQAVDSAKNDPADMLYMFLNSGLWTHIHTKYYTEFRAALLSRDFGRRIVVSSARREAMRQGIINRSGIRDDILKTVLAVCLCSHNVESFIDLIDHLDIGRHRCAEALLQVCGIAPASEQGISFTEGLSGFRKGSDKPPVLAGLLHDICGSAMQTIFPLIAIEAERIAD